MNDSRQIPVFGREGQLGWVDQQPVSNSEDDIVVRLENGTMIQVPADILVQQADGSYYLPMSRAQFETADKVSEREHLMVIPVIMEEAQVSKRRTERRVRIHKQVSQREEVLDETGFQEEVSVERVPVNKVVESAPRARYEGKTLIIPVLEEVLVVQKQLVLKEEVHVTKRRTPTRSPQRVTLRAENISVERDTPTSDRTGTALDDQTSNR